MRKCLLLVLLTLLFTGCENNESKVKITPSIEKKAPPKFYTNEEVEAENTSMLSEKTAVAFLQKYGMEHRESKVRFKTRLGDIDVLLYKNTPIHRANFIFLIKQGYYSNTQFHRVVKDFIIQAGRSDDDYDTKMRKKIGLYKIPAEFNGKKHHKGALSAARQWVHNPKKKSDAYEFFIITTAAGAHHLDQEHTVFGKVVKGLDVVDKINALNTHDEWPVDEIHLEAILLD